MLTSTRVGKQLETAPAYFVLDLKSNTYEESVLYFDQTKNFGSFTRFPITGNSWTLPVTGLRVVGGATISFTADAALSTKTPFIMIPSSFYDSLNIPEIELICNEQ